MAAMSSNGQPPPPTAVVAIPTASIQINSSIRTISKPSFFRLLRLHSNFYHFQSKPIWNCPFIRSKLGEAGYQKSILMRGSCTRLLWYRMKQFVFNSISATYTFTPIMIGNDVETKIFLCSSVSFTVL